MNVIMQQKDLISSGKHTPVILFITENGEFLEADLSISPWQGSAKLFDTKKTAKAFARKNNLTILELTE